MENNQKLLEFKRVAKQLNKLGVVPVLYGSLGLSVTIKHYIDTDDIDILIEDEIFESRLNEIRAAICVLGYELVDLEENEFKNKEFKIGVATDGDMLQFSGIDPSLLKVNDDECKYRVLNTAQYLSTYEASMLDGYRKEKHKKDDLSKIQLIKSKLIA